MITENLFDQVLVKPAQEGGTELLIVSGYVGVAIAHRQLNTPVIKRRQVRVRLVYGMARREGISIAEHGAFQRLVGGNALFECHYRVELPAVHSKVYVWMANGEPMKAFVGSANYTQPGFGLGRNNGEAMAEANPRSALEYFEQVLGGSMEVGHADIEQRVVIHKDQQRGPENGDCRVVSLLSKKLGYDVARSSGLNWGFRASPGYNRNLDEAYIQIGTELDGEGFFPPRPTQFTVRTDDGLSFVAVRAQKTGGSGQAIVTPPPGGNALLGGYFRRRLGLDYGTIVTREHLEHYGRTDVEFCKIDEETFFMDFSV